jgi:FkbM family methyltransferase
MEKGSNAFLDCGSNKGQGLNHFVNLLGIDELWEIHAFEPNPKINIETIQNKRLNIVIHKKAVWTDNSTRNFKLLKNNEANLVEGVVGDKQQSGFWGCEEIVPVECIDFWEFVSLITKENVYIKMDIEWAEYQVIEHMLNKGWPNKIRSMWVEFHGIGHEEFKNKANELITQIEKHGTKVERWT